MSAPARPAVATGLAVVRTQEGLLVEGGASRQLFTGAAAHDLLPRLLPLLDGRTTLPEAAETLSVPMAQVAQAVAVLHRGGLLRSAAADYTDAAGAFLSRCASHHHPAQLRQRLAESTVAVAVTGSLGGILADDLAQTGIGKVSTEPTPDAALALATDDRLAEAVAAVVPVLRLGGDAHTIELGPLFAGPETACPPCFLSNNLPAGPTPAEIIAVPKPATGDMGVAAAQLLSALAVGAVTGWVTGLGAPAIGRRMDRIDVVTLDRAVHEVTPSAGCETCTFGDEGPVGRMEWLNRRASWQVTPERAVPVVPDLDLAPSPRIALDQIPPWMRNAIAAATARPFADTYLLGAQDLPHPVYRWSPQNQALIAARGDLTVCPPLAGLPPCPVAVLVFVAAPGRLSTAYAEQGMRRAFLAAGRAVAAVSRADIGHHAVTADTIDPVLAELLELHVGGEHVAEVVGLYPGRS